MGRGKNWTPEEDAYLSEMWGYVSIDGLGKHLNRSRNAVIVRVRRLGLPPFLESGDYVTMNQLLHALGYGSVHAYHVKSWVEERDFPMKIKMRSSKAKVKVVYLEDFWAWAEKNRSFVDFSRMEPLALGKEPAWVQKQRRIDYRSFAIQRKDPWTEQEDSRLKMLLGLKKYGYKARDRVMREVRAKIKELSALHYGLRKDFIEGLTVTKANRDKIVAGALMPALYFAHCSGANKSDTIDKLLGYERANEYHTDKVLAGLDGLQEKDLARAIYAIYNDNAENWFADDMNTPFTIPNYDPTSCNIMLQLLYRWLESLGYEPSTEEQTLRDGSHEIYHRKAKK